MRRESTIAEALALVGLVLVLTVLTSLAAASLPALVWVVGYQLLVVTAPVVIFALLRRDRFDFGLGRPGVLEALAAIVLGAAVAIVNIVIVIPNSPLSAPSGGRLAEAIEGPGIVTALVVFALLPAIGEELLFRGVLLRAFARRGPVIAIGVSALLFAGFHFSPAQLPPLFLVGVATGVATIASGVGLSILVHIANNALAVVLLHTASADLELGPPLGWAALVAAIVTAALLLRGRLR